MSISSDKVSKTLSGSSEQYTGWLSVEDGFWVRIVGTYTGTINLQIKENEDDTNIGTVDTFTDSELEQLSELKLKSSAMLRIGVAASGLTSGTPYVAIIK